MADVKAISCGLALHFVGDLQKELTSALGDGYSFVAVDAIHPRARALAGGPDANVMPFFRPDTVLSSADWRTLVVLKMSDWINVDSPDEAVRRTSEKVLQQELLYAGHVGVQAVLVKVDSQLCVNLARIINDCFFIWNNYQYAFHAWILIPMESPSVQSVQYLGQPSDGEHQPSNDNNNNLDGPAVEEDPWEWWNVFRGVCGAEKHVGLVLRLTENLPSKSKLDRWMGEPVRCIVINTSVFINNKKGYPVLPRAHQRVLRSFFKLDCQVMVDGSCHHGHMWRYYQYLKYVFDTMPEEDPAEKFARGFEDYLQVPLQPLKDNLETATYENFEKDPVKYNEYQRAIYLALMDKGAQLGKDTDIVVMVVGAGRGPLVTATLNAARRAKQKVRVYAIEKNPNAVHDLHYLKETTWKDLVIVVSCDVREYEAPEKADIMVSELLGSFGDNELSPECLDGAQCFLKDDGISIPCEYTSYLAPLHSHKLHVETAGLRDKDQNPVACFETPYVVRLQNVNVLADPQPLFTFVHPNREEPIDNSRYKILHFDIKEKCYLHGFAGCFDTILYKDVKLSIHPDTRNPGLISWFPIFFPLKVPVPLPKGCTVELHFWRCVTRRKVWYEWLVACPEVTTIHNPQGRSHTIDL